MTCGKHRYRRTLAVLGASALCAIAAVAACSWVDDDTSRDPLYLSIVVHSEEDTGADGTLKPFIPDYDGDPTLLLHFTTAMRAFATMVSSHGAVINFGSDWTFSRGVALHDPGFYRDLEAMGHEIDAHAHESHVPYHEVRDEILRAGGHPTSVVSGLNEQGIQASLTSLDHHLGEFRILWGVALPGHGVGECTAGWVWRPSRDDWTTHDADGAYIYVGHGELVNSVEGIRRAVAERVPGQLNTYAVFVAVREFKAAAGTAGIHDAQWTAPPSSVQYWENLIAWWDRFLEATDELVAAGDVVYASLTDIAATFEATEDTLVFDVGEVPRSAAPLRARNLRAGYPAP